MLKKKKPDAVIISAKEYKRLLVIQEKVEILKAFYFRQPAALENHATLNVIFNFDNLGQEVDVL